MAIRTEAASKLTRDIAQLLSDDLLKEGETVPVVVYSSDPEELTSLEKILEGHDATLRHRHRLTGAASAWIPLSGILELAELDLVKEIELDQPSHIA